ncbi:hypothetical protein ADK58_06365 [Streptomyces sp. XY152]|nr:hypothetical protein ADK58_06365 [Streptomyces sp. XY152]
MVRLTWVFAVSGHEVGALAGERPDEHERGQPQPDHRPGHEAPSSSVRPCVPHGSQLPSARVSGSVPGLPAEGARIVGRGIELRGTPEGGTGTALLPGE